MVKSNQFGGVNVLIFPLIVTVLLLMGAGGFAVWAYQGMQDYKLNVDSKIADAKTKVIEAEDAKKDAQYAEEAKQPLRTYAGPDAYGGIRLMFPKTWSGYVDESGGSGPVNGYFAPNIVPGLNAQSSSFALRIQVISQSYSSVLTSFNGFTTNNKGTATAYSLPKLPNVIGLRLDGEVQSGKQGSMVILPLRDKTIEIWTEAPQYVPDFNSNILPNLTFSP